jgi:CRISPR-associated endonuclease Csn1
LTHLEDYNIDKDGKIIEQPELAFSPEGIEEMNKNILDLNNGKPHQPILKVRTYEPKGNKFNVGHNGNRKRKFVEAAKGTNLYFAIYQDENGKRSYDTIGLNIVIERLKQGLSPVPEKDNHRILFWLSPNDLVYVPTEDEIASKGLIDLKNITKEHIGRIYKIVSFTGNRLYAIPYFVSQPIVDKLEYSQLNKMEVTLDKRSLKDFCLKMVPDRLGSIKKIVK